MKKYYPKAQEPEFAIGQKKHMDYKQLGGPELDEVLVLDVKNRPGSKDDPSDLLTMEQPSSTSDRTTGTGNIPPRRS